MFHDSNICVISESGCDDRFLSSDLVSFLPFGMPGKIFCGKQNMLYELIGTGLTMFWYDFFVTLTTSWAVFSAIVAYRCQKQIPESVLFALPFDSGLPLLLLLRVCFLQQFQLNPHLLH